MHQSNSTFKCNDEVLEKKSSSESLRKRFPKKALEEGSEVKSNSNDKENYLTNIDDQKNVNTCKIEKNDPIRWFSVFAPQSLRSAQKSFLQGWLYHS